jgi:hypothetical protein
MGINKNQNYLKFYIKIPKQQTNDSALIFRSYLWNKFGNKLNINNVKVILR